jgi:hypothetical protein
LREVTTIVFIVTGPALLVADVLPADCAWPTPVSMEEMTAALASRRDRDDTNRLFI